ncbi:unnamed protein product [Tilletia laevis]|uniref:FHA domain-containing protein n=2 Tax=Tilletia TaxID=13289 RepID=A0A177UPB6_9BASI|nr:hypothetical protein CF335_g8885 [Tilletia laevis]KAE8247941.1 hypothetical protein A4X03_0g6916 [Tilletia caries]CAD6984427.1 unnamed protein product [Tilletia controversa]KAE8185497.1 hypothetical protein CF336_g7381 [Tilletia laevis]CAD6884119.1 unnamed protein product [Tilletia caries]
MLTFIKFTPLDPTYKPFTFLLHPRLKRSNIIDDHLLILEHFFDDEVRIQLWGESPAIWSSRFDLGVYVNHQLLDTTPSQLHDGDIVAFPQRRYNLKTAVRFRVQVESLELSCGVEHELEAMQTMAQELLEEQRGHGAGTSSDEESSDHAEIHTPAPPTFSYAALIASRRSRDLQPAPPATTPSNPPPTLVSTSLLRSPRAYSSFTSHSVVTAAADTS